MERMTMTRTNLFDRGDPLPWPRRGHERARRDAAGGHEGELVDKGDAEAEEDAPRPRGPRWRGGATDTWGGGGGAGAERPRAGPSQSDEEEVGACREGGHGDEQAAAVGRGTGRSGAMCSARERVVALRASQRQLCRGLGLVWLVGLCERDCHVGPLSSLIHCHSKKSKWGA
jgi:hypothetical protein